MTSFRTRIAAALFLWLAFPHAPSARTWYVDPAGTGDQPTLQAALDAAAEGDSIVAMPGTYAGKGNRDLELFGKEVVLTSKSGALATIIDCASGDGEPHRALYIHGEVGPGCVISGLTIRGGRRLEDSGAGVWCVSSSPRFQDCVFVDNQAGWAPGCHGGGVAAESSSPSFEGCTFQGNCGGTAGGGVYGESGSVHFNACLFSANTACFGQGGAVSGENAVFTFDDCVFDGNQVVHEGGTGGAIAVYSCLLTFDRCTFTNNVASHPVDGIGGAIASEGGEVDITDCLFMANSAAVEGGALSLYHGSSTVTGCTFASNTAPRGAGRASVPRPPATTPWSACRRAFPAKTRTVSLAASSVPSGKVAARRHPPHRPRGVS